jgi:ubiquinone/menaquinone biosynthesis C-methylase UbiE
VVDIGAGDGRTYRRFQELGYGSYTAVDMCQKLLDRHPGANDVRRVQCDLSHWLALEDESADVITSFFIIEHIEDIQWLIEEIMRVLRQDGVWILTYFPQRRPYLHQIDGEQFKITQYYHRYEDIEQVISQTWAQLYTTDLLDEWVVIGKVFAIVK